MSAVRARPARRFAAIAVLSLLASLLSGVTAPAPSALAAPEDPRALEPGVTANLSESPTRSLYPSTVSSGKDVYTAWVEEGRGIAVRHLDLEVGVADGVRYLSVPDGGDLYPPVIAADGDEVHVVWRQWYRIRGLDLLVAFHAGSTDGGRTWVGPARVSPIDVSTTAVSVAVEGPLVAVGSIQAGTVLSPGNEIPSRLHLAVSSNAGVDFAELAPQDIRPGALDIAVGDGLVYAARMAVDGALEVFSTDASGADVQRHALTATGEPVTSVDLAAGPDGLVTAGYELRQDHGKPKPVFLAVSSDRFASTHDHLVNGSGSACVDCWAGPEVAVADDGRVTAVWRSDSAVHEISTQDPSGGQLSAASTVASTKAPLSPHLAVTGTATFVTWFSQGAHHEPHEVHLAARTRGSSTWDVTNLSGTTGESVVPGVGADGGNAVVVWMELEGEFRDGSFEVLAQATSVGDGDLALVSADLAQGPLGIERLVADRPTAVRLVVRNGLRSSRSVPVRLTVENAGATAVQDLTVPLRPGQQEVFLPPGQPLAFAVGPVKVDIAIDPDGAIAEADESNNTRRLEHTVETTRPVDVLVAPVQVEGETGPSCAEVVAAATGLRSYLKATFPVAPDRLHVVHQCATPVVMPAATLPDSSLTGRSLMSEVIEPLRALDPENVYEHVVGIVRPGWADIYSADHPGAVGLAFAGGKALIADARGTGGWEIAHEISHDLGFVEEGTPGRDPEHPSHLELTPAPGYWVEQRTRIDSYDWMYWSTKGADIRRATDRWVSETTWDFLLDRYAEPAGTGMRSTAAAEPRVLTVQGVVGRDGGVRSGHWWSGTGTPSAPAAGVTAELRDGEGTVVSTADIGLTTLAIGDGEAETEHVLLDTPFHASIPLPDAAEELRLVRGGDILLTRTRSPNAPTVRITSPTAGAQLTGGQTLHVGWQAADADGDALRAHVSLSSDSGRTWVPLAGEVDGTSLDVPLTPELARGAMLLRVRVSDGWDVAEATTSLAVGDAEGTILFLQEYESTVGSQLEGLYSVPAAGGPVDRTPTPDLRPWTLDATPDGSRIAMLGARTADDRPQIQVTDADYTDRQVVLTAAHQSVHYGSPTIAPDGSAVAFSACLPKDGVQTCGLWIHDLSTGERRFVVSVPDIRSPDWSPDGQWIVFRGTGERTSATTNYTDLFAVHPDGTGLRNLSKAIPDLYAEGAPSFGPDSRTIVFEAASVAQGSGIGTMDLDGSTWQMVLEGYSATPRFSPGGHAIVYGQTTRAYTNTRDVHRVEADGTNPTRLTTAPDQIDQVDYTWIPGVVSDPLPPALVADAGGSYTGTEGAAVQLDASASVAGPEAAFDWDIDGDGAFDDATGPTPAVHFPDDLAGTVAVRVTDASGAAAVATAEVAVGNRPPRFESRAAFDRPDTTILVDAVVTDVPDDDLVATVDFGQGHLPATATRLGEGRWRISAVSPAGATAGWRDPEVLVTDDDGGSWSEYARRSPMADDPPTAGAVEATTPAGVPVRIVLPATDPEDATLLVDVVAGAGMGDVVLEPSVPGEVAVVYTPRAGQVGTDTFTYRVVDAAGQAAQADVTVAITPAPEPEPEPEPNAAPVAADVTASAQPGMPVAVALDASDPDGDVLQVAVGTPASGTATVGEGLQVVYTSEDGFEGQDTFTYTVTDPAGATATASVTVAVAAAEPEPYPFEGFLAPVEALPTVNVVQAGRAVPMKFRLGGDRGLDVLADGSPSSRRVACTSDESVDLDEEADAAGESGLTYDATADQYVYVWSTARSWAGTCRRFTLTLDDGTVAEAAFRFR